MGRRAVAPGQPGIWAWACGRAERERRRGRRGERRRGVSASRRGGRRCEGEAIVVTNTRRDDSRGAARALHERVRAVVRWSAGVVRAWSRLARQNGPPPRRWWLRGRGAGRGLFLHMPSVVPRTLANAVRSCSTVTSSSAASSASRSALVSLASVAATAALTLACAALSCRASCRAPSRRSSAGPRTGAAACGACRACAASRTATSSPSRRERRPRSARTPAWRHRRRPPRTSRRPRSCGGTSWDGLLLASGVGLTRDRLGRQPWSLRGCLWEFAE